MSNSSLVESIGTRLHHAASRGLTPFGAEHHRFEVQAPVAEREVADFESRHQASLPEDYRAFLTKVSRGGAGPAYGLLPFGESQLPDGAPPTFLQTPFPHEDAFGVREDLEDVDDSVARAGTLALCDEGCGYIHLLVCTGPTRGQMWIDGTVSDAGFIPLGVGFLEWFERWLDSVLKGGSGTWWLTRPDESEFAAEVRAMTPWWRRR